MNDIKGFYNIPTLHNNSADTVAKFGELSPKSKTFSRDPRVYSNSSTAPDVTLNTFRVVDGSGARLNLPGAVALRLINLGQWLYTQHDNGAIPSQIQNTIFAASLATEHNVTNVTLGTISSADTASKRLPSWVRCVLTDGTDEYQVKIWLQDANFFAEYEHYEIYAVAPTPQLSDLRLNLVGLVNVLATGNAIAAYADREAAITNTYPKTETIRYTLTWHDLSNPDIVRDTDWLLIVYGNAGTDHDAVKEAIRSYIADNSAENDWNIIYPALYSENEFCIIPTWNTVAVPASGGNDHLFSPTITPSEATDISRARLPASYAPNNTAGNTHLSTNLRFVPTNYRQLGILTLGNPSNVGGIKDLKQKFPDMTAIPSNVADFTRMEPDTRDFIIKLLDVLNAAYEADVNTSLPADMTRVMRSGRMFIGFTHVDYEFMVLARISY